MSIERALVVKGRMELQTRVSSEGDVVLYGCSEKGSWQVYARGKVASQSAEFVRAESESMSKGELVAGLQELAVGQYAQFAEGGLLYGESFQTLKRVRKSEGEVRSELESTSEGFVLSPLLLDGCLQSLALQLGSGEHAYLPVGFSRVWVRGEGAKKLYGVLQTEGEAQGEVLKAKLRLYDEEGEQVCGIEEVLFKRARAGAIAKQLGESKAQGWMYGTKWRGLELQAEAKAPDASEWFVAGGVDEWSAAQKYAQSLGETAQAVTQQGLVEKLKD